MYSQSIENFVQLIYKWTEFTPQLEQKDENIDNRHTAARVLKGQSVLSEEIGQALAVVIDDQKDQDERSNYSYAFSSTEREISLSSLIDDEIPLFSATDDEIAESLINEAAFSREEIEVVDAAVSEGDWPYLRRLEKGNWRSGLHYESWLSRSFYEQLVWYIEDGNLCLQYAEQLWKLAFKSREQQDQFMAKLQKLRANLGVPQ